nr:mandelate racemase/muconate lactonizing enzyme family protein [Mesorhizobium sp.]
MKIKSIKAYHVVQPFVDGPYRMSKGRVADCFDAVIVAITSDSGVTGWGEMAPLGNFYSAAFPAGTRAGVPEIAPHLIGHDPRGLAGIGRLMDTVFEGHPYIKAALDMACWDLAARAADVPLVTMLGGRESEAAELYRVVTHGTVDQMAALAKKIVAEGYHRLQVKVGGNVRDDIERVSAVASAVPKGTVIFCDANAGWTPYQARQFADATRGTDYTFEQPCTTIEENMSVRRMLDKPMVLDSGGHRRRRDRYRRHGASVAVDAGRAPVARDRLPRMGDSAHRFQQAAGDGQPHGHSGRTRPRHRCRAGAARQTLLRDRLK